MLSAMVRRAAVSSGTSDAAGGYMLALASDTRGDKPVGGAVDVDGGDGRRNVVHDAERVPRIDVAVREHNVRAPDR
jgi:hypothetical protein